jgi:DNA-binding XRE family transcriptional regulator
MPDEQEKRELKQLLTDDLPVLRAKMRMTQDSLTKAIGISRQTYTALETRRREMSWNVFVLLYLFFDSHEETRVLLQTMGDFRARVQKLLKTPETQFIRVNERNERNVAADEKQDDSE